MPNPFTLEPCKTCGRTEHLTGAQMKREILTWAGIGTGMWTDGGNMSRAELMAVYIKIFGGGDEEQDK